MPKWSAAKRSPSESAVVVTMTPLAMWVSFVPETAITPQPVRDSPGSNPAMRMVFTRATPQESLSRVSAKHRLARNCLRRGQFLHERVAHFVIGVDVLRVVMVVERVQELAQRFAGVIVAWHRVGRPPNDFGRLRRAELGLQRIAHRGEIRGPAEKFVAVA